LDRSGAIGAVAVVWKTVHGGAPGFLASLKAFEELEEDFTKLGHAGLCLCR